MGNTSPSLQGRESAGRFPYKPVTKISLDISLIDLLSSILYNTQKVLISIHEGYITKL